LQFVKRGGKKWHKGNLLLRKTEIRGLKGARSFAKKEEPVGFAQKPGTLKKSKGGFRGPPG